jgi:hypothetical protein
MAESELLGTPYYPDRESRRAQTWTVPDREPRSAGAPALPDRELQRIQSLARILDRFFVDPLLGLFIPGGGDLVGSLLGLYTVAIAIRRRVSPVVIARMLLNLAVDALLGVVPLVGDLFDLGFRAHERNVRLLAERAGTGGRATLRDWLLVIGAAAAFVGSIALAVYAVVALLRAIF